MNKSELSMIVPIGLVASLVTDTEGCNKVLDQRIAQLHAACPGAQAD